MNCDLDYDPVSACRKTLVNRARKTHQCSDCGGKIKVGESYLRIGYVYDGQGWTAKRCADCQHVRCMIDESSNGQCRGLPIENLGEFLAEAVEWGYDDGDEEIIGAFNASSKARGGWLVKLQGGRS